MEVSRSYLQSLINRHSSLRSRYAGAIARGETIVSQIGKTAEISGSALAFGVAEGKMGPVEFLGIPLPLLAGFAGHAAAFTLVSNRNAHHFHNLADGALAAFAAGAGRGIGQQWKATGKLLGSSSGKVRGGLGDGQGQSLDDSELARLARSL